MTPKLPQVFSAMLTLSPGSDAPNTYATLADHLVVSTLPSQTLLMIKQFASRAGCVIGNRAFISITAPIVQQQPGPLAGRSTPADERATKTRFDRRM